MMAQSEPLSVCQMLNFSRQGQEVTVRGVITGGRHGYFLTEGIGDEPCPGWPKRYFTSPAGVYLNFFSSLGVQLTAEEKRLNLDFVLHRLGALRGGQEVEHRATIKGVLARRPWLLAFRHTDGTYSCIGRPDEWCLVIVVVRSIVSDGN